MRLRTFTAHDMPSAMTMVREELGDNAIILKTSNKGKGNVTITAAVDEREELPASVPAPVEHAPRPMRHNNEQSDQLRFDMQEVLRFHNVPELFISKIMQQATDKELAAFQALKDVSASRDAGFLLRRGMEKLMAGFFHYDPLDFSAPGARLMLVGPPGIGKTLTIAKMAARLVMHEDPRTLSIITTDNKRAGGFEQLQSLTNIMGVQLQAADSADELDALLKACKPRTRVLVDTAGCNPYDDVEMQEIKTYTRLAHVEPIMVLPAGGDSLEAIDIVEAFMDMPIERLLITRTDTAKRFGGILAAAASHKLAFCHSSSSSSIVDSLHPIEASDLAGLLLNYKKRH